MKQVERGPSAFLGIDVSKEKGDVFLLVEQRSSYRVFANNMNGYAQLSDWLQHEQVQTVHACLEATGCYSDAIAQFLFAQRHTVSVLNPAVLVNYRKSRNTRSKTDKLDARVIGPIWATATTACLVSVASRNSCFA